MPMRALVCLLAFAVSCGVARADGGTAETARVDALVARLTPAQELALMHGGDAHDPYAGRVPGIAELGIPPLQIEDGPAGVRDGWSFAYPAPIALAASFDPALAARYGAALGGDARAKGANVVLGPDLDLARLPANGRTFEGFGEDPWLASALAGAEVGALQATHVVAVAKHYVAYNRQTASARTDVIVDPRSLRELYAAPFAAAVRAGAGGVMCAYNRVGGDYACENRATYDLLERELGFAGFVVSDWYAQHDVYKSILGGLDLEMPRGIIYGDYLTGAVARGNVTRATLDRHVRRVVGAMASAGLLDAPPPVPGPLDVAGDLALARRVATGGAVLLRDESGELPLDPRAAQTVALIGASAGPAVVAGGGSSMVRYLPDAAPGALAAVRAAAGPGVRVVAVDTAPPPFSDDAPTVDPLELRAPDGTRGWSGAYYSNPDLAGAPALVRDDRRVWFQWGTSPPAPGISNDGSVRWTATLRVRTSGAYAIGADGPCACRLRVGGAVVRDAWTAPAQAPLAPVDLRAGVDYPVVFEWHRGGADQVRLAWRPPADAPSPELEAAVAAARAADRAVVLAGDFTTEGADRRSLRLSPDQERLIAAVAAVNAHTTVVLETGGAVITAPWLANVRALVELWYPGEAGGLALADLLFGRADPGGRLPLSFPATPGDVPATVADFAEAAEGPAVPEPYAEGLDVGYRWYDARGVAPQFPFGFGLSYGRVALSNLAVAPSGGGGYAVSVDVANAGSRAATAVPQAYLGFPAAAGEPPRVLRGAASVALAPGATRRVAIPLDADAFRVWDTAARGWRRVAGTYAVTVGASSRDAGLVTTLDVR